MQAAGCLIDLGIEFTAGMQRAHDDFERRLVLEFRMRIDRNAAAIIGHGQIAVSAKMHVDEIGVTRQRLVHRVVDDFGEQMVQGLLVGAADIHAGTAADRLKSLEHLDVARGVAGFSAPACCGCSRAARLALGRGEQVACAFGLG